LKQVMQACQGTKVKVSMFQTMGALPAGVGRVFMPSGSAEAGYPYEAAVGYQGENTATPSAASLKGTDPRPRRQWLYLIENGNIKATVQQIEPMLHDSDLYVRRGALRALGKLKDPSAIPAIQKALKDPESCVRCQAAVVLGDMGDPASIDPLFRAVADNGTFQFDMVAAVQALSSLGPKDMDKVIARVSDPNATVRRIAAYVMQSTREGEYPQAKAALLKMAQGDQDPWNRELAFGALVRFRGDKQVIAAMQQAISSDPDQTVQSRTAVYLAWLVNTSKVQPFNPAVDKTLSMGRLDEPAPFDLAAANSAEGREQRRVLNELVDFFKQYGQGCDRSDKDWGWRAVGNAILSFNDEGRAALQKMIDHPTDKQLADLAWRVVWIPQKVMAYVPATAEQDEIANRHRPK
jgi:HEAT repeat protein